MRKQFIGAAAAMLAIAAFGCGGSNNNNTWTCSFAASAGICYEWTSPNSLNSSQISQLQQSCTGSGVAGASFSTGATCPSSSRVGTCAITNVQVNGVSYKWVFYSPTYTAQTGQQFCTITGGTWTPG